MSTPTNEDALDATVANGSSGTAPPSSVIHNCRMYEQKYPEVDDLVMVDVRSIAEMGAYVSLLEYNNIEGMILLSELSRRRIRSISKLIRVGRQEIVVVLRVDKEKGYIDLSKRRVSSEDIVKCEEKYNKSKTVHSIMRHVAEVTHTDLEELYKSFGWPLYRRYGHAIDAFKMAISDPDPVFEGLSITPVVKEALLKDIKRRLTPQAMKLRADIELNCFTEEGIDAIKIALHKGQLKETDEVPIKIKLVAPPAYVIMTTSHEKEKGINLLNESIDVVKKEIEKHGGNLLVKTQPRAVSEREEKDLANQFAELEQKNREVTGDSSSEGGSSEESPIPADFANEASTLHHN